MRLSAPTGTLGPEAYEQRPIKAVLTSTILPVPEGEVIVSGGHGELAYGWDADPI